MLGSDMKIGIINVGLGNISSIQRMLHKVGVCTKYVTSPAECSGSDALILPGVGHFDEGVRALHKANLFETIRNIGCNNEIPILGICLGMQLLCRSSEEGSLQGLGLISADVEKFRFPYDKNLKVPHMGWNVVRPSSSNPLISSSEEEQRFYFVHSYRVIPDEPNIVIGTANYGSNFCAAFQKNNIFGVQFHPEKSHRFGMALMKSFIDL